MDRPRLDELTAEDLAELRAEAAARLRSAEAAREHAAIVDLQALAARWPASLTVFPGPRPGGLMVVRTETLDDGDDSVTVADRAIATADGIPMGRG